jgi:ribose/xylose/arabinose/galactoside ABC-type transport system permease subunit
MSDNSSLSGGNIFKGELYLKPLKFIWAVLVVIFITLLIGAISGLLIYGIIYFKLPYILLGLISFIMGIAIMYLPYDYIYSMGYDDGVNSILKTN